MEGVEAAADDKAGRRKRRSIKDDAMLLCLFGVWRRRVRECLCCVCGFSYILLMMMMSGEQALHASMPPPLPSFCPLIVCMLCKYTSHAADTQTTSTSSSFC